MLLYQPEFGYCYNSDSLFLYDFITKFKPRGKMLEVGAGSGVIGLLVARDFEKLEVEAVEKQDIFVEFARKNADANSIDYRVFHTDFLDFSGEYQYDYIISNPPFYHDGASQSENSVINVARYSKHLPMNLFFKKVATLLSPKGHFIFCYDAKQFFLICTALEKEKFRVIEAQFIHPKFDRSASLVLIHSRRHSKSLMKISEPLFAFEGDEFSKYAQSVYKKADTMSIKC